MSPFWSVFVLTFLATCGACYARKLHQAGRVNPVLLPLNTTTFFCPVRREFVYWEKKDVFNPTALVRDGKIHLLYRAEDDVGVFAGTSRIGLATSEDGLTFVREPLPIFYPDNDIATEYEWEGGCEDPRIVEYNGTYYMTYTAYDGTVARLLVASSPNLRTWTKYGPLFGRAENGTYIDLWSKSGAIVTELQDEKFVAKQINGKFWMYWGDTNIYAATSDNLVDWTPITDNENGGETQYNLTAVFGPRRGMFDSDLVEPGPQAFIRGDGILLIYNSRNRNADNGGDPTLPEGTYSAGQVLLNATNPTQLLERSEEYFMTPDRDYEIIGQVNNVVFVEGLVSYKNSWYLYYGTADSKIAVAAI
ncbi:1,4-beta-mannosyl-N-acetylglucosamine phosphorylase [Orchesella cincta]|uniref:1,4-beta-mannosyl-N-acetylglucosamine phosphorylase n=1 Tax=Orchesella cincta TaxID=48709 RepID=A0A1D2NMQ3_ORCCI|nr:1,4-beta-mannosyl-N-acetylglucosamine phosphorylase [Orchesella cincta]